MTGHQGRFLFGYVQGVPIVAMQGRVHYYEGYEMSDVVLPTRLMGLLGAKTIILTNAAGGVNYNFCPGDLMMITDHITTAVPSPLIGSNLEELGPRFPDMSEVYKKELRDIIKEAARNMQVSIQQGVYTVSYTHLAGPESIWAALKFGARRIGHGVRCLEDKELVAYLRENQIPLEVCPTSNFQTKAVKGEYPLKKMLEEGLCVTLNTDNTTVSGTTLEKEYEIARTQLGLTEEEISRLKENAEKSRF